MPNNYRFSTHSACSCKSYISKCSQTLQQSLYWWFISFWAALDSTKSKPPRKQKEVKKWRRLQWCLSLVHAPNNVLIPWRSLVIVFLRKYLWITLQLKPAISSHYTPLLILPQSWVPCQPPSAQSESACENPDLAKCLNIEYDNCDFVPGVSYRILNGEEGWTPVVKKKRIRLRGRTSGSSDNESDGSGSEIDISCSRLVEFEKQEGIPGLMIYRRGPPTSRHQSDLLLRWDL